MDKQIVTIDGPAGSGKSSAAQKLAEAIGFTYYNTGLIYRALGLSISQSGQNIDLEENCLDIVSNISQLFIENDIETVEVFGKRQFFFSFDDLRTPLSSHNASVIGSHDSVNELIVELLLHSAPEISFVAEGRNTGSAVFADADIKFYLDANIHTRAIRHYGEATLHKMEALKKRDGRDSERSFAPLCEPTGAIKVDSTEMNAQEVVDLLTTECKKVLHLNL